MDTKQHPWFVLERSKALASWLLTSRKDVRITSEKLGDDGVDLLLEIDHGGLSFPSLFVVVVRGALTSDLGQWKEIFSQSFPLGPKRDSLHIPACLFVVNVRTNEAQYSWIAEPVVGVDSVELRGDTEGRFDPLTVESVNDIVNRVRDWYAHLPHHFKRSN